MTCGFLVSINDFNLSKSRSCNHSYVTSITTNTLIMRIMVDVCITIVLHTSKQVSKFQNKHTHIEYTPNWNWLLGTRHPSTASSNQLHYSVRRGYIHAHTRMRSVCRHAPSPVGSARGRGGRGGCWAGAGSPSPRRRRRWYTRSSPRPYTHTRTHAHAQKQFVKWQPRKFYECSFIAPPHELLKIIRFI